MLKVSDRLNIVDRETWPAWKELILKTIDGEPKDIRTISRELGIIPDTDKFGFLIEIASDLEKELKNTQPKIRCVAAHDEYRFLLYRVDQTDELIEKGVLSAEEIHPDLRTLAKSEGLLDKGFTLHKERI
jgi:hypothetical protein